MGILAIDDRDPLLSYSSISAWNPGGVSSEYNSTTTFTSVTGSTVNLTFTGTRVSVFGTINPNSLDGPPSSSYSIDNGSPTLFSGTQTAAVQYQQRFYASGTLTPTTHTLLITVLSKNATYFLDYITVVLPDPGATSLTSSSSSSSSSLSPSKSSSTSSSSLIRTSITLSSTTGSSTSSSASHTPSGLPANASSTSHMGAIVGGVIGGIALIVMAILAILFIWKHRREKKFERKFDPRNQSLWTRHTPSNSQLTPFVTSRYQPIDNNQFGLMDNPRMAPQTVVPYTPSHMPPALSRNDPSASSKSAFSRHAASPSQHSLLSQIAPTESSSARGASAHATTSGPSVHTNISEHPPPRYDD
ncbi:hypothetical protein CVT25_002402 [Psilocybe cyanescens]|uniref:Mid2 domain-containing protein n=1 Tax=Psilocybe cyanescens TaxID=93625 RepID=A0A409WK78_PSICY|nr:hypothetical protein CVT25_002402 [Psilocybe cyanescens]